MWRLNFSISSSAWRWKWMEKVGLRVYFTSDRESRSQNNSVWIWAFYGKLSREGRNAPTSMVCVGNPRSLKILLSPAKHRKSIELDMHFIYSPLTRVTKIQMHQIKPTQDRCCHVNGNRLWFVTMRSSLWGRGHTKFAAHKTCLGLW